MAFTRRTLIYTLDALVLVLTIGVVALAMRGGETYDKVCTKTAQQYDIEVAADRFAKTMVAMQRCDTMRVHNAGPDDLHLAIGKHEKHLVYPGYTEQTIRPGESLTFVARQTGRYQMHDHLRDIAVTTLLIRERD